MKVAIVIGHSSDSPGAKNGKHNVSEFDWNEAFAIDLMERVGKDVVLVYRDTLQELPAKINAFSPDFIISLHCNAYDTKTGGTETLYYHTSAASEEMAKVLQKHVVHALCSRDRGVKAKTSEDRGGYLLRYTIAPCVIAEPFFIDFDMDFENAMRYREELLGAFCSAIEEIEKTLKEKK